MAWIELHQTLPNNKKLLKLKRLLKLKTPQAVGHLCLLWLWALDNAADGSLAAFEPSELAEVCEWTRKPEELLSALVQAGFVTKELAIHNWEDYTGRLLVKREAQREQARLRQRRYRERLRADNAEVARDGSVRNAPIPYRTEQNQTLPVSSGKAVKAEGVKPAGAVGYFLDKVNPAASAACLQELQVFAGELGEEVCKNAIDIARDEQKTGWSYIRAILQRYHREGVRSVADIRAQEAKHKTAGQAYQQHAQPLSPLSKRAVERLLQEEIKEE